MDAATELIWQEKWHRHLCGDCGEPFACTCEEGVEGEHAIEVVCRECQSEREAIELWPDQI